MPESSPVSEHDLLKREITNRLRPVCANVPDDDFGRLVDRIAYVQWKYEQRKAYELLWPQSALVEGGDA
jgi:hypothetical protein